MSAPKRVFTKELDSYAARKGVFRILTVPPRTYLMIDGHGNPNTEPFSTAVQALYPLAYTLKFASKAAGNDYVVPPLEARWWADDMSAFTTHRDKSQWNWTLMLLVPETTTLADVDAARAAVHRKGAPARLDEVRVESLDEGLCLQTLHVGPFDLEGPVLDEMHHRVIPENGLQLTGRHHEIYLSDLRRTAPERLRTILRQQVLAQ